MEPSNGVTVHSVESADDLTRFVEFPWEIYASDPNWVPPTKDDDRKLLSKEGPFFADAEGALFLASRGGRLVGRIAATHDRTSNDKEVGTFGYFECVDDVGVARALFDSAERWLGARGPWRTPRAARSSPDILLGAPGVFLGGEPGPPVILMAYNPPYYPALYEACGYRKAKDLVAYWGDIANAPFDVAKTEISHFESHGLRIRKLDKAKLDEELAIWQEAPQCGLCVRRALRIHTTMTDADRHHVVESFGAAPGRGFRALRRARRAAGGVRGRPP